MASLRTQYFFPHFPPPPSPTTTPPSPAATPPPPPHYVSPPTAPARPSQPPPHVIPPPPPPHTVPPPSPTPFVPPSPDTISPPQPHIIPPAPSPPPTPGNHSTIILVVFVSFGGVFFLAFVMAALWCFLKKKKKMVRKAENVHIDEHRKVMESIVQGPDGTETVILSVEDDIHIEEDIMKSEVENFRKGLHLNSGDTSIPGLVDAGEPSSSSGHHHHG